MEPTKQDYNGKKGMISYQTTNLGALQAFIANFESSRKCQTTTISLKEYHNIIQEQLSSGILEYDPDKSDGKRVFYMPHRAVNITATKTTKMRIVFDASAKESNNYHWTTVYILD